MEVTLVVKRIEKSDIKVPRGEIGRRVKVTRGKIERETEERDQSGPEEEEWSEESIQEPKVEEILECEWI